MKIGLLWYDADNKKPLREKLDEAIDRYADKFGSAPTACHVHPAETGAHPRLRLVPDRHIRPHHFWLGEEDEDDRRHAELSATAS